MRCHNKLKQERRSWLHRRLAGQNVLSWRSFPAKSAAHAAERHPLARGGYHIYHDAFRDTGLSREEAIAETLDCYPEAGIDNIKAILSYRATHTYQAQL